MTRPIRAVLLAALILAGMSASLIAHEDDPKVLDRVPPYAGPGYRSGGDTGAEPLGGGFPSSGVQLLSWITLPEIDPQANSGNDCWGYVSGSGREYALFGYSRGTAFVEVTDPGNPAIIAVLPGPESLWRDIKVYQSYAYAVSEGGSGIQVFNLSAIDSGVVNLVNTIDDVGTSASHNVALDETSGFLYRCGGSSNGLRIYSLADPANPGFVGQWLDRYVHDAEIVTFTSGPYAGRQIAFCCSGFDGGWNEPGVDILDVTNKSNIQNLSRILYSNPGYSHQCWLSPDGQFLYQGDELDEGGGVPTTTRVFDVSDLSNPVQVATYTNGNSAIDHNMYARDNLLFQANYRSGLRVLDVTDPTAPVEVAYFDTWPDDDNPNFNGLWSNYPFFPSGTILGSDLERGLFVWRLGLPKISFAYPDGLPERIHPDGDSITVEIIEEEAGILLPDSAKLYYDVGGGFVAVDLVAQGGGLYVADFPATPCGSSISFYVRAEQTDGIILTDPIGAPGNAHAATSAVSLLVAFEDEMETSTGWSVGAPGDDASTGVWVRVDPVGTSAQPENDHTEDPAVMCWVTGQGLPGGSVGENDVDGGSTTLTTPVLDLGAMDEPLIRYWRWYSNDQGGSPNQDVFVIDITNDGVNWVNVETVGPAGPETSGGWILHEFRVTDFVAPTAQVRMRFVASDLGDGSIVEAAIDDFRVDDLVCSGDAAITVCGSGAVNAGCGAVSDILTVNGSTGGASRTMQVTPATPLSFVTTEAPAREGDTRTSRSVFYIWLAEPTDQDILVLPKNLGPMCFGPPVLTDAEPFLVFNSIGAIGKLGPHTGPGDPPVIPDGGSLEFYSLPGGFGQTATLTVQGIVQDDCSQGNKPFSVTNGVVLRIE